MARNPNPDRITEPMWRFQERVVALEPDDFELSGIYADKKSYHNTVNRNLEKWPGEYSTQLKADLIGDRNKARAVDISSRSAKRGDYRRMAKYGNRLRAAYDRRDPRLRKWREVLGQADADAAPEGLDFQGWYTRVPDDTHMWHFHMAILTQFVNDPEAYEAMFSVLTGQTLAQYQGASMAGTGLTFKWGEPVDDYVSRIEQYWVPAFQAIGRIEGKIDAEVARDQAMAAAFKALSSQITSGGGNVDIIPVLNEVRNVGAQTAQKFADLHDQLASVTGELMKAQVRMSRMAQVMAAAGVELSEMDDDPPATPPTV